MLWDLLSRLRSSRSGVSVIADQGMNQTIRVFTGVTLKMLMLDSHDQAERWQRLLRALQFTNYNLPALVEEIVSGRPRCHRFFEFPTQPSEYGRSMMTVRVGHELHCIPSSSAIGQSSPSILTSESANIGFAEFKKLVSTLTHRVDSYRDRHGSGPGFEKRFDARDHDSYRGRA